MKLRIVMLAGLLAVPACSKSNENVPVLQEDVATLVECDEIELAVFADDSHRVLESEGVDVEVADLIDGVDSDDRHERFRCCFVHCESPFFIIETIACAVASIQLPVVVETLTCTFLTRRRLKKWA